MLRLLRHRGHRRILRLPFNRASVLGQRTRNRSKQSKEKHNRRADGALVRHGVLSSEKFSELSPGNREQLHVSRKRREPGQNTGSLPCPAQVKPIFPVGLGNRSKNYDLAEVLSTGMIWHASGRRSDLGCISGPNFQRVWEHGTVRTTVAIPDFLFGWAKSVARKPSWKRAWRLTRLVWWRQDFCGCVGRIGGDRKGNAHLR